MDQPQQITIKGTDELLAGRYANGMQAVHTKEEVVLDFVLITPPHGQLVSRVVVSPVHAKRIAAALTANIKKYEQQYGPIAEGDPSSPAFGF